MFRSLLAASTLALIMHAPNARAQQSGDLDGVLRQWEKVTREVKSVSCGLERVVIDKSPQSKVADKGFALFLRGNGPDEPNHFRFELKNANDATLTQKFIGGGRFLYSYEPMNKVVRVFQLAPFKAAVLDRISLLSFIFEMDAEKAKARYHVELAGTDGMCHYVRVRPKSEQDKRDFAEARISVNRAIGLPALIWYREPNDIEITWNFLNLKVNSDQIDVQLFNPAIPEGWRLERIAGAR